MIESCVKKRLENYVIRKRKDYIECTYNEIITEIAECILKITGALGVGVVIEAKHLCMMMRGVSKQNSVTTTSAFTGEFEKEPTRNEFIKLISSKLS